MSAEFGDTTKSLALQKADRRVERSIAVDLVRVAGVIAIVVAHNWDQRLWAHTWFYTWHVPVFFVITGYL
jgi:fucose 4-O-acetylase-like acetyltransferase